MPIGTFACSLLQIFDMNNFFRTFFAALLALTVFAVIILIVVIGAVSSVASSKEAVTGEKAVLVVDLSQHFAEVEQSDPVSALTIGVCKNKFA